MNEEEKKAIEELSKKAVICNYEERDYPNMICFKKDMIIALNLIEKLQKENEELKKSKITYEKVRDIQEKNKNIVDNNYIPKQKIKDKIEEINKMIAYEHNDAVIIQLGKQKRVLQKLLESEE